MYAYFNTEIRNGVKLSWFLVLGRSLHTVATWYQKSMIKKEFIQYIGSSLLVALVNVDDYHFDTCGQYHLVVKPVIDGYLGIYLVFEDGDYVAKYYRETPENVLDSTWSAIYSVQKVKPCTSEEDEYGDIDYDNIHIFEDDITDIEDEVTDIEDDKPNLPAEPEPADGFIELNKLKPTDESNNLGDEQNTYLNAEQNLNDELYDSDLDSKSTPEPKPNTITLTREIFKRPLKKYIPIKELSLDAVNYYDFEVTDVTLL